MRKNPAAARNTRGRNRRAWVVKGAVADAVTSSGASTDMSSVDVMSATPTKMLTHAGTKRRLTDFAFGLLAGLLAIECAVGVPQDLTVQLFRARFHHPA
jgi:hypothetical protein